MLLLVLFVGVALGVSFVCSMLEAVLLSSRNATLAEQRSGGSTGAGRLLDLKRLRIDDAISAILILNTLANTLGATMAGAQAAHVFGKASVGIFSGVLTLLILVLSEIIPKTLGAVYVRSLSAPVGWVLSGLTRVLAPILVVSRTLTRFLTKGSTTSFSRGELSAVIDAATSAGAITDHESRMVANVLRVHEARVEDVMTPRTVAFMMPADATVDDLLSQQEAQVFSRIPLFDGSRDQVVGYVLQIEVLRDLAIHANRGHELSSYAREIAFIPELAGVDVALRQILNDGEHIAVVTDEHGGVAGLVTLEDLTETLLGVEIVDESDRVVDLREAAMLLRDRRQARLRRRREPSDDDQG